MLVGPTPSHVHMLGLARDLLVEKGFFEGPRDRARPGEPAISDGANVTAPAPADEILQAAKPIIHLGRDKAFQYHAAFKDHIYSAYPCFSLSVAEERMTALYSARTPPGGDNRFQDLGLDTIDVEIMKVTFAIAMILEGENDNPLCRDLPAYLLWNVDNNINEEPAQLEDVIMATLLVSPLPPTSASFCRYSTYSGAHIRLYI